jgi:YD repeat-containing protein
VASVTEGTSSISYTYDGAGRVLTETNSDGTVRTYTYDSMGRRATFALTKNNTAVTSAAYTYDALDRLVSATENGVTTTHTYDANGNRTSTAVSAQNTKTEYTFNRANLVTSAEHKQLVNDAWVTLSTETCTYYVNGDLRTRATTEGGTTTTTTYTYDKAGRLTQEVTGTTAIFYVYDARGNRTFHKTNKRPLRERPFSYV